LDDYPKILDARLERLPHPAYSPDLSPCDFSLFGMLKGNMKDHAFQRVEEILEGITFIWNGVIFEQLQSVFFDSLGRLESVISNWAEYYIA
jgi:hypothetical protein